MQKHHINYYDWLVDEEYGKQCKDNLVIAYNCYFDESDSVKKKQYYAMIEIYMPIVCDVIAYRYIVKNYSNLLFKLNITVEEYLAYKSKRLLDTVKQKKDKIDDILSYVYMSFMLSSPRLIYDYGEKIGRCKSIRHVLPYHQVARNRYFNNKVESNSVEHFIFNVDNLYLDDESQTEAVHSNIDKYSLQQYEYNISLEDNGILEFENILEYLDCINTKYPKAKQYLLGLFKNWKNGVEDEFLRVKSENNFNDDYSLIDYINYCYENGELSKVLNRNEYMECLSIYNSILKRRENYETD